MKAARYYGPGDIRIDDVPEPRTRPGTVMVKVEWCGICGTDLHEYLEGPIFAPAADAPHPLTGETVPITLGHEFAGVVHEVGDGVDDVHVGDRVVVEPYITAGTATPVRRAGTTSASLSVSSACRVSGESSRSWWSRSVVGSTRSATSAPTSVLW
jgi:(R,R)-butanediol dehydrogenase / meso-butanediol dehydrogenase / diacetyl reductase